MLSRSRSGLRRIGVISDTHGWVRPEAVEFLRGADFIIHAGDIGDARILEELAALAPLTAVRGNNDTAPWARKVAETQVLKVDDVSIYVLHNLAELAVDPAGYRVIVSGHSHQPKVEERAGVLYVNPGSAGPRRFKLPISIGELRVEGAEVKAKVLECAS